MGTARVSVVRFFSTCLKTLSVSSIGGPSAATAAGLAAMAGTAFGRGRHLVLEKSAGCTGPTYVHNRYIVVRYSGTHKNYIYIYKETKIK
jgi:hypothetical protein